MSSLAPLSALADLAPAPCRPFRSEAGSPHRPNRPHRPRLRSPFPYPGGKSRIAAQVWERFGDTPNYCEPFFGSGALLLGRPVNGSDPRTPRLETVNDADAHLANFWRAVQSDPDAVARFATWPVNEVDLTAKHTWLSSPDHGRAIVERLFTDPDFYDAKCAGWWLTGICQWIGDFWCGETVAPRRRMPMLSGFGRGILALDRRDRIPAVLAELQERLRHVRVCCGDWTRILSPAITYKANGTDSLTAIALDPPYGIGLLEYAAEGRGADKQRDLAVQVREWALANGENPLLRIAYFGYAGAGHEVLEEAGWSVLAWKSAGGYSSRAGAIGNRLRERVWFSPFCLPPIETRSRQLHLGEFADANSTDGISHEGNRQ